MTDWWLRKTLSPVTRAEVMGLYAALLTVTILLFSSSHSTTNRLDRDETRFISNGIATTACLLEVFRNVQPLLARLPKVDRPLHAFLVLQGTRYGQNRCPDSSEQEIQVEASRLLPVHR